ncbi:MAG: heme o synthase [Aggregatilineales bacterium]
MESAIRSNVELKATLRAYLELAKLRIVLLLLFTTLTAMVIASGGIPPVAVLLPTLLGGALAAAGSSTINQYLDRDMDAKMARTARRPIPSGRISPLHALVVGVIHLAASVVILAVFVNGLAALLALAGGVYYVVVYTMLLKRNTSLNIVIGGGAGAIPVLVGWAAVTGGLTLDAWLLFAIVFYWTPPHSWALALLVNADYARAGVPMMPVARGEDATRRQVLVYSLLLLVVSLLPVLTNALGALYLTSAALLGAGLVWHAVLLLRDGSKAMARRVYKYSTFYLALLFMAMMFDVLFITG